MTKHQLRQQGVLVVLSSHIRMPLRIPRKTVRQKSRFKCTTKNRCHAGAMLVIIRAVVRPEGPRTTFSISLEVLQTGQLDLDIYSVDSAEERVNLISESQYRSIGQEMVLIRAVTTLGDTTTYFKYIFSCFLFLQFDLLQRLMNNHYHTVHRYLYTRCNYT